MKISREWLADHITLPDDLTPQQLAHDITLRTVEVEHVDEVDHDVVFEVDNKSLTNRPDLWGHHGMARELSAIYRLPLTPVETAPAPSTVADLVELGSPQLCPRFVALSFDLPHLVQTPEWMARRLKRVGEHTGMFLVDLSNYVMLTTGQPNHVYDRDLVTLPLTVTEGEDDLTLLSGTRVDARGLGVIRDGRGAVGLAGVVGGQDSAVRAVTVHGLLELAAFPAMAVRRASQRTGVRTEASARYEKAIDTQRIDQALGLFLAILRREVPDVVVHGVQDVTLAATERTEVTTSRAFLRTRIGEALPDEEITGTLERLGFEVRLGPDAVETVTPTWRSTGDIGLPHDILEELARIHGYDRIPIARIGVTLRDVRSLGRVPLDRRVRESLARQGGLQEVVTYPWAVDASLAACGLAGRPTVRFQGAPSPDRGSLRPTLLPNLLEVVEFNLRQHPAFGIFEVGMVFDGARQERYRDYETMPAMVKELGVAIVGPDGAAVFGRLRGLVDVLRDHGWIASLDLGGDIDPRWADPSARVGLVADGAPVGELGLVQPRVLRAAGITGVQVGHLRLDLGPLRIHDSRANRFVAVPELPESRFDLSVVVAAATPWAAVEASVRRSRADVTAVDYLGDFRGDWVPDGHKSLSLRVTLTPRERTFASDEVTEAREAVLAGLGREVSAELRAL